ncbi:MAG: type II toxin-antitoxin system CcdA family antitoxin [Methylomonas sp.]
MLSFYDQQAPKRPANLSVNSDLLNQAKQQGINLSAAFEQMLIEQLKVKQRQAWISENQSAIAAYNQNVEQNGVFSDHLRSF